MKHEFYKLESQFGSLGKSPITSFNKLADFLMRSMLLSPTSPLAPILVIICPTKSGHSVSIEYIFVTKLSYSLSLKITCFIYSVRKNAKLHKQTKYVFKKLYLFCQIHRRNAKPHKQTHVFIEKRSYWVQ